MLYRNGCVFKCVKRNRKKYGYDTVGVDSNMVRERKKCPSPKSIEGVGRVQDCRIKEPYQPENYSFAFPFPFPGETRTSGSIDILLVDLITSSVASESQILSASWAILRHSSSASSLFLASSRSIRLIATLFRRRVTLSTSLSRY